MKHAPPLTQNPQAYNTHADDDEIDFRELLKILIQHKKTIGSVFLTVLLASILYALLASPLYKAKIVYLPPTQADVAAFAVPGVEAPIDTNTAYVFFEKNLNSINIRRSVFDQTGLLSALGKQTEDANTITNVFARFNQDFAIEKPKPSKDTKEALPFITLSLQGKDPILLAKILTDIDLAASQSTKQELIDGMMQKTHFRKEALKKEIELLRQKTQQLVNDQITQLQETDSTERKKTEDQINTLRASAKTKRLDYIQTLTEAAKVAESIGLIEKSSLLDSNIAQDKADGNAFYTEVTTQAQPLYLRGSKALRAEIKELTERQSDDPFIPGLRDLQDKLELLKNNRQIEALRARKDNDAFIESLREKESELQLLDAIKIDPALVKVATVDQAAFPPEQREKPKRSLIVALGAVAGLFLGIIAAFLINFWQDFRREETDFLKSS